MPTTMYEEKMKKTLSVLQEDFATIRVGRANPHILDKILVDYYGTPTPLNQVGNITVPEAKLLQIQPWEPKMIKAIVKAIAASDIGINPTEDGKVVRLVFPDLTEQHRKNLTKDVSKRGENAKVALRNIRRDAIDTFKKQLKNKEISEDVQKDLEEQMQKLTDKYVAEVDKITAEKNKDIMAV